MIVILALVALMVFSWFSGQEHIGEANYSQFAAALEKQQVKSVTFTEQDIVYQTREGKKFHTLLPPVDDPSLICLLYTSPSPRDRTRSRMPSSA